MEFPCLYILILIFPIFIFISIPRFFPKSTPRTGFANYPFIGTLPEFILNRHRFLDWSTQILSQSPGNTSFFSRPGGVRGIMTANPANIEHMLKTNFQNYPKGTVFITKLHDFLGQGIFNADGDIWKTQRKTASYEFSTRSLRNFVMETAAVELQTRFIPLLEKASETNMVFDLQNILERFAFDNISTLAFNVNPGGLAGDGTSAREFMQAFDETCALSFERFMSLVPVFYKIKKFLNIGSEAKLRKSIAVVHKFADEIIKTRMDEKAPKNDEDLLSRFIRNSENSPEYLRDIVISFLLAGRDSTSSGLTWFFWLLSLHPEIKQKVRDELKEIRKRSRRTFDDGFDFNEIKDMQYLQAAISESLRLYPPVPIDTKHCLKDDVMPDGTFVAEGWFVTYTSYGVGRMESVWGKDCKEFRPERWLEEEDSGGGGQGKMVCKPENPFKYPVFHGGPRICLGKEMAYIQMKAIAATVIEMFEVEVVKNKSPEPVLSLTMRMKDGLPVRVKRRSPDGA